MNLMPDKQAGLVKELGRLMNEYGLTKISIIENESTQEMIRNEIILEKDGGSTVNTYTANNAIQTESESLQSEATEALASAIRELKSPIVGVFYSSASPESDPFVRIGDTVKKGDVVCILEAMKLMNEIYAEQDGKIVDICVQNGDVVEFGQVLFKYE